MNGQANLKWIYALMLGVIALFSLQAGAYIAHSIRYDGPQCVIVTYVAAGLIVGYTLIRAIWRIAAQAYLTRKWLKHFRSRQHAKHTKRLAYTYRSLGADMIVVRDDAFVALAIGMLKPTIVISEAVLGMFSGDEVKAIVLHEAHHCRNRDNAKLFLARLLAEAFGYLPIMRALYRYYQTWTELLADRHAIRRMGTELPLASVLFKLAKLGDSRRHAAAVHFATATMQYRIAQVLEPDKAVKVKVAWVRPMLVTCSLLLLLLLSGDS